MTDLESRVKKLETRLKALEDRVTAINNAGSDPNLLLLMKRVADLEKKMRRSEGK